MKCSKCGKEIANDSVFCEYCGVQISKPQSKKKIMVVLVLCIIALFVGGVFYYENELDYYKSEISVKNEEIRQERERCSNLESEIGVKNEEIRQEKERYSNLESQIASGPPFVITDVEIGSTKKGGGVETSFGSFLYKNRVSYISPKIYYTCFVPGSYCLKTKLYEPDGVLSRNNSSSPNGYTQSEDYYLSEGTNSKQMNGWGYESPGNYSTGIYKIEIWYNDKCLFVKSFTIYS